MAIERIEIQIMNLEDEIKEDLAEFPSWIRFLLYWYLRWKEPEERDDLDRLFRGVEDKQA